MKFTGHERDLGLPNKTLDDLDYMHARHYSLNIGRFLSVDPQGGKVGSSQSWNRYSYVRNSPIAYIDPSGETTVQEARWALGGMSDRDEFFFGGSQSSGEEDRRALDAMGAALHNDAETAGTASDPFFRPEVRASIYHLFKSSRFGLDPNERSAWLAQNDDGKFRLIVWPFSGTEGKATWHGALPPGLYANMHTHPRGYEPWPSGKDKENMTTLLWKRYHHGPIPVYTLSRSGVWKWDPAIPDVGSGRGLELLGGFWWRGFREGD